MSYHLHAAISYTLWSIFSHLCRGGDNKNSNWMRRRGSGFTCELCMGSASHVDPADMQITSIREMVIYSYLFEFTPVLTTSPLLYYTTWDSVMFLEREYKSRPMPYSHGSLLTLKWEVWEQETGSCAHKGGGNPAWMTFCDVHIFSEKLPRVVKPVILQLHFNFYVQCVIDLPQVI